MTEAQKKKLAELRELERQDKQKERNRIKSDDRTCQRLFGMTTRQVKEKLAGQDKESEHIDYWQEYNELKELVDRLMGALPNRPNSFEKYVEFYEQKKLEKEKKSEQFF